MTKTLCGRNKVHKNYHYDDKMFQNCSWITKCQLNYRDETEQNKKDKQCWLVSCNKYFDEYIRAHESDESKATAEIVTGK